MKKTWIVIISLTYLTSTSSAQEPGTPAQLANQEEADRLYKSASANMEAGNFERAANEFEAADAREPSAVSLLSAATAWESARRDDRAANSLTAALALDGLPPDVKQTARQKLAVLQLSLGVINVVTPGYLVQIEDDRARQSPFRVFAKPGNRRFSFRLDGGPIQFNEVGVLIGQVTPVKLAKIVETTSFWSTKNSIGVGLSATGITALGVGVFFGVRAARLSDENKRNPTPENASEGRKAQTLANTLYVSGGVLTTVGIALILWPTAGKSAAKEMLASGAWSF
jgi:hypothetical protein